MLNTQFNIEFYPSEMMDDHRKHCKRLTFILPPQSFPLCQTQSAVSLKIQSEKGSLNHINRGCQNIDQHCLKGVVTFQYLYCSQEVTIIHCKCFFSTVYHSEDTVCLHRDSGTTRSSSMATNPHIISHFYLTEIYSSSILHT